MTRREDFRQLVRNGKDPAKSQATPRNRGINHPVPLDEFDRERMGIAAKE
jgi:hypothetical protein